MYRTVPVGRRGQAKSPREGWAPSENCKEIGDGMIISLCIVGYVFGVFATIAIIAKMGSWPEDLLDQVWAGCVALFWPLLWAVVIPLSAMINFGIIMSKRNGKKEKV